MRHNITMDAVDAQQLTLGRQESSCAEAYLDLNHWPKPEPGETVLQARLRQVAAIDARAASLRREQARKKRPLPDRIGSPHHFPDLVPWRPFASDDYARGTYRRPRPVALRLKHLQINDKIAGWLAFDIDTPSAHEAAELTGLPEPTFVAVNPDNGHAHLAYLLAAPVARFEASSRKPIDFLADIQRGMMRRLGADRSYPGLLIKNPTHPHWRTEWRSPRPFTLEDLNANLSRADKRRGDVAREIGEGRNVTIFEQLRQIAYREIRKFYRNEHGFRARLFEIGLAMNGAFEFPMSAKEVGSIARSIAKWTIRHFTPEKFSDIQRSRVSRRWANHAAESTTKPWEALSISRATYYRRKAAGQL